MSPMSIVPFIPKVPKVLHKLNTSTVIAVQALLGEAGSWVAAWSGPDGFGENAPDEPEFYCKDPVRSCPGAAQLLL